MCLFVEVCEGEGGVEGLSYSLAVESGYEIDIPDLYLWAVSSSVEMDRIGILIEDVAYFGV
jgi:hypothetical protein